MSAIMPRFTNKKGIWYIWYSHEDFENFWVDREEASGYITSIVSKIEWLRLAMIFKIEQDCIKISFRSQKKTISAEQLAKIFWWGGHFYAAGAKVMKDVLHYPGDQQMVEMLVSQVMELLDR